MTDMKVDFKRRNGMSNETENIEELRKTLILAKDTIARDDYDENSYQIFSKTIRILGLISNNKIYDLKKEVIDLLVCNEENVRKEAVATLGYTTRLHLPEFKEIAYQVWLSDTSSFVKRTALSAWASYFLETRSPLVLTILYSVLIDEDYNIMIRSQAYISIFTTIDLNHPDYDRISTLGELLKCKSNEEFNGKINWNAIHKIMCQYAPEVLNDDLQ
jgi:hypothetical protein